MHRSLSLGNILSSTFLALRLSFCYRSPVLFSGIVECCLLCFDKNLKTLGTIYKNNVISLWFQISHLAVLHVCPMLKAPFKPIHVFLHSVHAVLSSAIHKDINPTHNIPSYKRDTNDIDMFS